MFDLPFNVCMDILTFSERTADFLCVPDRQEPPIVAFPRLRLRSLPPPAHITRSCTPHVILWSVFGGRWSPFNGWFSQVSWWFSFKRRILSFGGDGPPPLQGCLSFLGVRRRFPLRRFSHIHDLAVFFNNILMARRFLLVDGGGGTFLPLFVNGGDGLFSIVGTGSSTNRRSFNAC